VLKAEPLQDSGSLASRALSCLCNSPSSGPAIKQAITAAGAVPLLAAQLRGSDHDCRNSAAHLLKLLLLTREPGVAQQLAAAGGIEAIVATLRESQYRHYSQAAGDVLQCLCMTSISYARRAADAGAILPVVKEIKEAAGPGNGELRMYWIGIFQLLLQHGERGAHVLVALGAGVVPPLLEALRSRQLVMQQMTLVGWG
jgi:hypothetical protein